MLISKTDKIYVAGHKGMVGSNLCMELIKCGYKNIITASRDELDLKNIINVEKWFKTQKPDVVVLAAAKVGGIMSNFKNSNCGI